MLNGPHVELESCLHVSVLRSSVYPPAVGVGSTALASSEYSSMREEAYREEYGHQVGVVLSQ